VKLKYKLPLILFVAFAVIISATFSISLRNEARLYRDSQYDMGQAMAIAGSKSVKSFLDININYLLAVEKAVIATTGLNEKEKEQVLGQILMAFSDKPAITNVYVVFERGAYFSAARTDSGQYFSIDAFHPESGGGIELFFDPTFEISEDDDWYFMPKKTQRVYLTEPYEYTYPDEKRARKMITLASPLYVNEEFIGAVGIDMELSMLYKSVFEELRDTATGGYAILVSHEGVLAVHPRNDMLMTEIGRDMEEDDLKGLLGAISGGEYYRIKNVTDAGTTLMSYVPMQPAGIEEPWSLGWSVSLDALQNEAKRAQRQSIMMAVSCTVAWGVFLLIFMSAVFGNITRTVDTLKKMTVGDGDLTIRLAERGRDEFGQMARGLNGLIDKLHATVKRTQEDSKKLLSTSAGLMDLSHGLSESAEVTLDRSGSAAQESGDANGDVQEIATEAERVSASAVELSATANEMGVSMDAMVQTVKGMNDGFTKMTGEARQSKSIADEAIAEVADAIKVISALGASAKEIGQFTDVIMGIAKKTNLLAINATVEAARAGEAGKGFAVVAGEVKQLANQSASNANDITSRIESIQTGAANAVDVINKISATMSRISRSANSIAQSIERETKTSDELANSVTHTNAGAKQVMLAISGIAASAQNSAKSAGDAAHGTEIVSGSIHEINENAGRVNEYSMELKGSAESLKAMAEHLDSIVSKFKT